MLFTTLLVAFLLAIGLPSVEAMHVDLPVPVGVPNAATAQYGELFFSDPGQASSDPTQASQLEYSFYWSIQQQGTPNETLHGIIQLTGTNMRFAWAGIGFGRSMLDAQFIICHQISSNKYADPTTVEMHEHTSIFKYAPPAHITYDQAAIPVSGAYTNNTLSCEFTRLTRPNDGLHFDLQENNLSPMLWGFNPRSSLNSQGAWFTYHQTEHRGALSADLASGRIYPRQTYSFAKKQAHGFGMMFVWLVLFPGAAFYARYMRFTAGWTTVHMLTQISASLLLATFVIVIFTDWINLSRPHAIFGLCLLAFIASQLVLGVCSLLGLSNEKLQSVRKWVRGTHNTLGFALLLASVAQIALGLDTIYPWTEPRGRAAWVIFIALVAFWFMLFISCEIYWQLKVVRKDVKVGHAAATATQKSEGHRTVTAGDVTELRAIPRRRDTDGTLVPVAANTSTVVPMQARLRPDLVQYSWETLDQAILDGGQLVVANGRYVYSIAEWMTSHPGGQLILHAVNGTDITNDYFHEAGFDAEEFVPKPKAPVQDGRRNTETLPRPQSYHSAADGSDHRASASYTSSLYSGGILQDMKLAPLMDERDWKLVVKSRRTHVHTRLAIQKLSNLVVGELVTEDVNNAAGETGQRFDPHEYRRYALVENTPLAGGQISKFRFCLLYPYDLRVGEPTVIYPGQSIEIQARIDNRIVSRYYCPFVLTSLSMIEVLIKIYPNGVMSSYLSRQKPGNRQVRIRGPFGKPIISPQRSLTSSFMDGDGLDIPRRILFIAGGSGITPFIQLLQVALLPINTPLRVRIDYEAQMDDELTLKKGDRVAVRHHYHDGWAVGVNLRTEEEGAFPVTVTFPRCGTRSRITLIHTVKTATETTMGLEWIEGATLAYPRTLEVHRFVSDGTTPPVPIGTTYPHGLDAQHLDDLVRERFEDVREEERDLVAAGKIYVCGPPGFDGWAVDQLLEFVDTRQIVILPSDRVL